MPSRSISAKFSKLWTYSGISSRVTRQNEFTPLRLNSPDDASVKVSFVVLVVVVVEEVPLTEALVVVVVVLLCCSLIRDEQQPATSRIHGKITNRYPETADQDSFLFCGVIPNHVK